MIEKIIRFSLNNRLIIGLLTLALIGWGVYNFTILPIDAVPDITNNQVQIITTSPSLAPQEVEQFITFPVEIAMANIQDVIEIRSISRSGLSVVTVVFKDRTDPYLARQLVNEQIKIAENDIPDGYGTPEMMPVTTGLGEIYQYVIEPEPGWEDLYNPMEIRTVQDWIVKRYLSGIPGIVDISSFGGYVKQFEVSIKPRSLVEMDITIIEIFNAIDKNNENTGGSYIEKGPEAYYIRAEGLIKSIEDIENIVIKNKNRHPVLIKDVATVMISHPPRFGAMTKDGKGEAVGGITLMLKGANTSQVVKQVKSRIEEVKKTLPDGLTLHPYLDRSRLINKTIRTVSKNLIEGGLIVIFVLVLLLGNFRAGIIVASVIPLSMLFAFSMMNLFKVSANLMSLGAIDFGLIVDGSVIMVEGIIYQMSQTPSKHISAKNNLYPQILKAGNKVGRSALFGVLIILIVYIPILAFTGIEGKMFKPMAQTVSFALIGSLILSLTYVPMVASVFLRRNSGNKKSLSDRIVSFLQRSHEPILVYFLKHKNVLIIGVILLVAISFFQFSRMGGEFIPTLEEGDLAAQMTLSPGSSLSESISSSTKAEKILLDNFPEVKEVVSKIGTAEVPTDPMAIEDADIMIILKDKDEWTSAKTREELVRKMKDALSVLPGLSFEFQQPIQLRFNELMTGVKSDVAIKIYGEDLDLLFTKANEAASIISDVEGAGDVKVEQIVGMPQLVIKYKRDKIAQYGLNIEDINKIIRTAYAGESAGVIFEGEKRFDLVVRLCEECRNEFKSVYNLRINPPTGDLILLNQVADISIDQGPMQISRDDTKRRITIGINIRNRDVESFVEEVRNKLDDKIELPAGYYITYGGQFENLEAARKTSGIAVPIALLTIFILLYFAFYSLKQAVLIFTAIPLAAVGGIWALYIREMPFSISAGVGFIALFGVAVLNGIVLIAHYNQLLKEGVSDVSERVVKGTRNRLRPVIMTASVAALGFIPMALSTAPGAEVQKPLATVVIGGLITATFLTLVVLPVIYVMFHKVNRKTMQNNLVMIVAFGMILFAGNSLNAQEKVTVLSLDSAMILALQNNHSLKEASIQIEAAEKLKKSSFDLQPVEFEYENGRINSDFTDIYWRVYQPFSFPTKYTSRNKELKTLVKLKEDHYILTQETVFRQLKLLYSNWLVLFKQHEILKKKDSLFVLLKETAKERYELGEINYLDKLMAETEGYKVRKALNDIAIRLTDAETNILNILNVEGSFIPDDAYLKYYSFPDQSEMTEPDSSARIKYYMVLSELAEKRIKKQRTEHLPDLYVGYFRQSIDNRNGFDGFQVGAKIPLWFWSNSGRVKSLRLEKEITDHRIETEKIKFRNDLRTRLESGKKLNETIAYYEDEALLQSDQIIENAVFSYQSGEISYSEYLTNVGLAYDIKLNYLDVIGRYNIEIIEIEFILSK